MMKYVYAGKEYTWNEFITMLVTLARLEENKKGFWKARDVDAYSFSMGFDEGMLFESKIIKGIRTGSKEYDMIKEPESKELQEHE